MQLANASSPRICILVFNVGGISVIKTSRRDAKMLESSVDLEQTDCTPRLQRRVAPSQCCLRSVDVAFTANITAKDELGVGYLGSVWAGVDGQLRP